MLNTILCDLTQEFAKKNYTLLSDNLQNAISKALIKKEKIILFLNRLGYARRIICQDCGEILKCPNCFISLSLLNKKAEELYCFKCGLSQKNKSCFKCQGFNFKFYGFTIGKIIHNLNKLYSNINIYSVKTMHGTVSADILLNILFQQIQKNDIILFSSLPKCGFRMIVQNNKINTVAILNTDTFLNLPDYTAGEKTYIMIQKIYKFAYDIKAQNFLMQTFEPKNYILKSFLEKNETLFYQIELKNRKELLYPPFCKLIKLIYQNKNQNLAKNQTYTLFNKIKKILLNNKYIKITPPLPCFPLMFRKNFRWQIIIKVKGEITSKLRELLFSLEPAWLIDVM